ncbi:MAG TPA: hypothetical protein DCM40_37465 [Maribacter sp.]|nr:hypothetical protein [Maribacter sp.]
MIVHISVSELEEEFREDPWKISDIYNLGIDYQTSQIDGIFEGKEYCVFKFSKYDIQLSNRWGDYTISAGEAGITINFFR